MDEQIAEQPKVEWKPTKYRSCDVKASFQEVNKAFTAIRRLAQLKRLPLGESLHIYSCRYCSAIHFGHPPKELDDPSHVPHNVLFVVTPEMIAKWSRPRAGISVEENNRRQAEASRLIRQARVWKPKWRFYDYDRWADDGGRVVEL